MTSSPATASRVHNFGRTTSQWERIAAWTMVAAAVSHLGFALAAAWPFTTDDAYITLRYARNLAAGDGIVWNVGEAPLEGYSNPFSLFLATLAILVGLDPVVVLKGLGVSTALASPVLAFGLARQFVSPVSAALAVLPISLHFGTPYWAVSGLETPIFLAMSLGAISLWSWQQARRTSTLDHALLGGLVGTACLVRPDGILLAAAVGLALILDVFQARRLNGDRMKTSGRVLGFSLGVLVTWGTYTVFRILYFGQLLPNSVLCKAMWTGDPLTLVRDAAVFGGPLALGSVVGLATKRRTAFLPILAFPALTAFSLVGADPIIGDFQRHFVASFGVLAAGTAVGIGSIVDGLAPKLGRNRLLAAQFAMAGITLFWLLLEGAPAREELRNRARFYERRMDGRAALANWIKENTKSSDLILLGDAGIIPYQTPNSYRDPFCLNEAALTSATTSGSPEAYASYIFESQRPEILIINENALDPPDILHGTSTRLIRHPQLESDYQWLGRWQLDGGISYLLFKRRE